ncbi:MAG: 4-hydroxy-3-methylbut-2-en-1-yl diphosphate synthase [Planctomycetes bacterium]|nr:4-hydroxy-3-methylbut-2-en-1-yl diphosphate synthase [Planctomycetota bacterium]
MKNARVFLQKLQSGRVCLGTAICLSDPTVVEALAPDVDLFWIDTEHAPISLESLKSHLMAIKGTEAAALVRVPWNDPVLMKPVLDLGADGIIVPMVRTAGDVAAAVAACRYPPEGIRGFGPLRPLDYGRLDAAQFCRDSNEQLIIIVQIEHIEAVRNIDEILAVPGLTSIAFGPQDLSASMGHRTQPRHPEVLRAMETVIESAQRAGIPVGISVGADPEELCQWVDMGIQWLSMGVDVTLMLQALRDVTDRVRAHIAASRE